MITLILVHHLANDLKMYTQKFLMVQPQRLNMLTWLRIILLTISTKWEQFLIFGGDAEVTTTALRGDTRVAGVVSENPAHLMNTALEGDNVTAVALTGRTPIKVVGVVQKGDMLISSGTQGFAVRSIDPKVGTVIGKALENKTDAGEGVIEAVVGRV